MKQLDQFAALFGRKAKKAFTAQFWRRRLNGKFWKRRLSPRFWEYRIRKWRDELAGLDFLKGVDAEELGHDPDVMHDSAPSGNKFLRRVLDDLVISPRDAIVDIGSGKGSAMRIMLEYPFSRVDGVEISPRIVEIARRNFNLLNIPISRSQVFQMNAARFGPLDPYNYFYFYSPFNSAIMQKVVANILASISHSPRPVRIIYTNPEYASVIQATDWFFQIREYPGALGHRILVYANREGTDSYAG